MAIKHFGKIEYQEGEWVITAALPHVCIKLKAVFGRLSKTATVPFRFADTPENAAELQWFMKRYPLEISETDQIRLELAEEEYYKNAREMESILMPDYVAPVTTLRDGLLARDYQARAADLHHKTKRLLLGDDLGLGKTLSAILTFLKPGTLPAIVVVQTHLTRQWASEIHKFTSLSTHVIKGTQPYDLPVADVYIIKYSCLAGWVDVFGTKFWKSAVFDEVQELRRIGSQKYQAGSSLSSAMDYTLGMSATPIYNFGDEIFAIMDLLKPGCLGESYEFLREWAIPHGMHYKIADPKALGTYLRDNYLMLRRTREEVGRELPAINKIVYTVDHDEAEARKAESLAQALAIKILHGSFVERGSAARELDLLVRHKTGVSKARSVAQYVKIILEAGEPVLLAGWHRDVYEIWKEELIEYNPVFYTGTESESQKAAAKEAFVSGKTNLFIISLRSGIGLDGLQHRCKTVVIGELDWSPQVHNQVIGRIDRDGQQDQVTVVFLISDYGSDPVIVDLLGLKSSQAHAIINPLTAPAQTVSDESRIKVLAEKFINNKRPEASKEHKKYLMTKAELETGKLSKDRALELLKEHQEEEDYEACAGIKKALEEFKV